MKELEYIATDAKGIAKGASVPTTKRWTREDLIGCQSVDNVEALDHLTRCWMLLLYLYCIVRRLSGVRAVDAGPTLLHGAVTKTMLQLGVAQPRG